MIDASGAHSGGYLQCVVLLKILVSAICIFATSGAKFVCYLQCFLLRTLPRRAPSPSKRRDIRSGGGYHLTRLVSERWKLSFSNLGPFPSRSGPEGPGGPPKPLFWPPQTAQGALEQKGKGPGFEKARFRRGDPTRKPADLPSDTTEFSKLRPQRWQKWKWHSQKSSGDEHIEGNPQNVLQTRPTLQVTFRIGPRGRQTCK